jgi:hypothetical protein
MGGRLVWDVFCGGGVPVVEVDPFGDATEAEGVDDVWMLALLFRLEPKPKDLKRELMTSTSKETVARVPASE